MKKYFLFSLLIPIKIFAIITFTPKSVEEIKHNEYNLNVYGKYNSGNTNKTTFGTENTMTFGDGSKWKNLIILTYEYSEVDGEENTNKGKIHNRFTLKLNKSYDNETYLQTEYDKFQFIKSRTIAGDNIRYRINYFERFFVGVGSFYSKTVPEEINLTSKERQKLKLNSYFIFTHTFNDKIKLNAFAFYQPTLYNFTDNTNIDFSDYRLTSRASLVSKITDRISFKINATYDYHSNPYNDVSKGEAELMFGLSYKFKNK